MPAIDIRKPRTRRRFWSGLALRGLTLAAALLFLARGVHWQDVSSALGRAGVIMPAALIALNTCMMLVRAWRLRVLVNGKMSFVSSFATLLTSSAINNITPFRGGTVAKLWMLERSAGVTKSAAAAVGVLENLLEIVVLAVIGLAASLFVTGQRWATVATPLVFCGAVAVLILVRAGTARVSSTALATTAPGLRGRIRRFVLQMAPGFRVLAKPGVPAAALLLSLLAWLCEAVMIAVGARGLGLQVSFPLAIVALLGINLALSLPCTPASAGPFEGAIVAVLMLSGLTKGPVVAFAIFYHAVQVIPVTVAGVLVLVLAKRSARHPGAFSAPPGKPADLAA